MIDSSSTRALAVQRAPARARALPMLRFIANRAIALSVTMLISSFVIFGALYLAPGTPISFLTQGRSVSPEAIAQLEAQFHLNEPFIMQHLQWLGALLQGDFGRSIIFNEPIITLVGARAGNSLLLLVLATVIVLTVGLGIGLLTGLKPGLISRSLMGVSTAVMAVPSFVAAVVLTTTFAVRLGWFPTFGAGQPGLDSLYHFLLPAIALSLASVAFVARLSGTAIRQELGADHVQTAISRGLPYRFIVSRHVVRNAAIPMLTVAGLTVGALTAGSVIIEQIFQLGGLGQLLITSVQQKDFPVVQAVSLIYVVGFIGMNMLIDIAYSALDPRVSLGKGRSCPRPLLAGASKASGRATGCFAASTSPTSHFPGRFPWACCW